MKPCTDNELGGTGHEENSDSRSISIDNHGGFREENLEHQAINAHTIADHISSHVERHSQNPPVWIRDYDSREGFSNEDHQGNLLYLLM
jgi:hypothetical protein